MIDTPSAKKPDRPTGVAAPAASTAAPPKAPAPAVEAIVAKTQPTVAPLAPASPKPIFNAAPAPQTPAARVEPKPAPAPVAAAPARKAKAAVRIVKAKAITKPAAPLPVAASSRPSLASAKPAVTSLPDQKQTISVAAAGSSTAQKGYFDMLNTTETTKQAAEKAQALFADASAKAKAAFEKSTKIGEELTVLTKGNVEALVESGKIAAKGAEALTQDAAAFGKKSFEHASSTFKSLTTVKSPTELFQIQSEFAKTSFDNAVAEASKFSEAWMKLAGDMFQPLSSRYAVAAEKLKSVAN